MKMLPFGKKKSKNTGKTPSSPKPTISKQRQKAAIIAYYIKKREEEKKP